MSARDSMPAGRARRSQIAVTLVVLFAGCGGTAPNDGSRPNVQASEHKPSTREPARDAEGREEGPTTVFDALCAVPMGGDGITAPREMTAREAIVRNIELLQKSIPDILPAGVSVDDFSKELDRAHITTYTADGQSERLIDAETMIPEGGSVDFAFDESVCGEGR